MNNPIKNKKVAILGWGVDTTDCIAYLIENNNSLTIIDEKPEIDWGKFDRKLFTQIRLGTGSFAKLKDFDVLVRNPAVYRFRPEIVAAEKAGVEVTSKVKLFFDIFPGKVIGVTGTKGKGTTSTLIFEMLNKSDKDIFLGGNIGQGLFNSLEKATKNSWMVAELSSFQLIDLAKSPHIGVVLMVTSEHLDWHKSTEEYLEAKANIVRHQGIGDFAVINKDYTNSLQVSKLGDGKKIFFSRQQKVVDGGYLENNSLWYQQTKIIDVSDIRLRGSHNQENILAAAISAHLAGVAWPDIQMVIRDFKGLEHRLEEVGTINGVTYYNDSFSTVPETAIAAIKAFSEPEIVILGGSEKGSDFADLGKTIVSNPNVKAVILIGLMTDRISKAIQDAGGGNNLQIITGLTDMSSIVGKASEIAKLGDVVLLSPAAASFDMFKNYKDRGQQFKDQVLKLKNAKK